MTSHVAKQGRKDSLTSLFAYSMLKHSLEPSFPKLKFWLPAQTTTPRQSSHPQSELEVNQSNDWYSGQQSTQSTNLFTMWNHHQSRSRSAMSSHAQDDPDEESSSKEEPVVACRKCGCPPKAHCAEPESFQEPPLSVLVVILIGQLRINYKGPPTNISA